jgi:hypothetical protein
VKKTILMDLFYQNLEPGGFAQYWKVDNVQEIGTEENDG